MVLERCTLKSALYTFISLYHVRVYDLFMVRLGTNVRLHMLLWIKIIFRKSHCRWVWVSRVVVIGSRDYFMVDQQEGLRESLPTVATLYCFWLHKKLLFVGGRLVRPPCTFTPRRIPRILSTQGSGIGLCILYYLLLNTRGDEFITFINILVPCVSCSLFSLVWLLVGFCLLTNAREVGQVAWTGESDGHWLT